MDIDQIVKVRNGSTSSTVKRAARPSTGRGRRTFDVVLATLALLLLFPLIAAVAVVVLCAIGRPVLFRQTRSGLGAEPFEFRKFRTMRPVDKARGFVSDKDRLTRTGRVLRALSLDELPSLWNVIRGDMSLIGPRPLLMKYVPRYTPEQWRRHEVRPGITGLAQVRGRNTLSWEQKFALDVWYVDNRSFGLDLRILFRTLLVVIRRKGICADGCDTAHEFTGQPSRQVSEAVR